MAGVTTKLAADRRLVMAKLKELGDWSRGLDNPASYDPPLPNAEIIVAGLLRDGYIERKRIPHEGDRVFVYKPVYAHEGKA